MKAKEMIKGQWYEGYGMKVKCMGLMDEGRYMMVAIDGDEDMQSLEGWPLDKDVTPIENPYKN